MIEQELDVSKLRDVIDFEVDYIKKSYEKELSEKDDILAEKDTILAEKDKEIQELKAKINSSNIISENQKKDISFLHCLASKMRYLISFLLNISIISFPPDHYPIGLVLNIIIFAVFICKYSFKIFP